MGEGVLYADAALWRTTDGARSWTAVATPGYFNTVCVGAGRVVGVPEYGAAGVEESTDGGAHWNVAYPVPGTALTGSSYAVCSPSSRTVEVTIAEQGTGGVEATFLASAGGGPWRAIGHGGLGQELPVAVGPRGTVLAAADGPRSLDVYRSDGGVEPMALVARLRAPAYPQPAGPLQGGFTAAGKGMLVLACGTSVFTAVSSDDGTTWTAHQGVLANPGYNTDSSC